MIIQTISSGDGITFTQDGSDVSISSESRFTSSTCDMPTMSNNSVDSANDIDFTEGFCHDLSTKAKISCSAMTKQLDAVFAEGTEAGGLDTGEKASDTWYHCFAISKENGTTDFLFSTSADNPTMPESFVNKRRIGSIKTDSYGNIKSFYQVGNLFSYNPHTELNGNASVPNWTLLTLPTVPTGIEVFPLLNIILAAGLTSSASSIGFNFKHPESNVLMGRKYAACQSSINNGCTNTQSLVNTVLTNSSAQIHYKTSSSGNFSYNVSCDGYIDKRGAK